MAAAFTVMMVFGLHLAVWAALARPVESVSTAFSVAALVLALCLGLGRLAARRRVGCTLDRAVAVRNATPQGAQMEVQTLGGLLPAPAAAPLLRS